MTEEKKEMVSFVWQVLRPDTRQYKQQSIELSPMNVLIGVEIPASLIISSGGEPTVLKPGMVVLTPEGMRYVQEQFEKLFAEAPADEGWDMKESAKQVAVVITNTVKEFAEDSGWGDTTGVVLEVAKSDDGWGDTPVFDDADTIHGNEPDTEKWDETKEDWA